MLYSFGFRVNLIELILFLVVHECICDCGCSKSSRQSTASLSSLKTDQNEKCESNKIDEHIDMILLKGGAFLMGTNSPEFPEDGEYPEREVRLSPFWLDKTEVSNQKFTDFTQATGYITEAEKFGNSFVFENLVDNEILSKINQAVANAPWWLPMNGANWKHPEGPTSSIDQRMDHPVIHVS